jgi:8-oxo-dGTP diphosphatase
MKNHVGLIIQDQDKLLFIQRSANKKTLPNIWAFPSGTVEEGETVEQTAVREAREELGVEVMVETILAVTELLEFDVRLHFIIASIKSNQPSIQEPDEIQAICWLTLPEFFAKFTDSQIGHGLIWLRQNPLVWKNKL